MSRTVCPPMPKCLATAPMDDPFFSMRMTSLFSAIVSRFRLGVGDSPLVELDRFMLYRLMWWRDSMTSSYIRSGRMVSRVARYSRCATASRISCSPSRITQYTVMLVISHYTHTIPVTQPSSHGYGVKISKNFPSPKNLGLILKIN